MKKNETYSQSEANTSATINTDKISMWYACILFYQDIARTLARASAKTS